MRAAARRLRLLPAVPARLHGWPLPWGGQRPAVFHRVRSSGYRAADRKPRAVTFGIRITLYHNIQNSCLENPEVGKDHTFAMNVLVALGGAGYHQWYEETKSRRGGKLSTAISNKIVKDLVKATRRLPAPSAPSVSRQQHQYDR